MNTIGSHFSDPPIEIASESPRIQLLQSRLSHGGMRPIRATQPFRTISEIPLLIDMLVNPSPDMLDVYIRAWKNEEDPRELVILGDLPEGIDSQDVVQLESADSLTSLKERLAIRKRETVRRRELELRSVTARMLGANETGPMAARNVQRVLYLGEGSRNFGALKSTLLRHQVELVAALTHLTALDYLSQQAFDAVLLEPTCETDEAAKFLLRNSIAQNPDDLKIFVLDSGTLSGGIRDLVDERGYDILDFSQPVNVIVPFLLQQLCMPREDEVPRDHSLRTIHDAATGLFSRDFLKTHLGNLTLACEETSQPLSLLYLTPREAETTLRETALRVSNALRESDLAARLDAQTICVVMPNTAYHAGLQAANRLEKVCDGLVDWTLVERRRSHSVADLMSPQPDARRSWARLRTA